MATAQFSEAEVTVLRRLAAKEIAADQAAADKQRRERDNYEADRRAQLDDEIHGLRQRLSRDGKPWDGYWQKYEANKRDELEAQLVSEKIAGTFTNPNCTVRWE